MAGFACLVSEPIKGPIVSGVSAIYLLSIVIRHNSCYLSKRGHLHELSLGPLDKTRSQCFTSKEARHLAIAEGRIKARPLQMYHGRVGHGLLVRDVSEKRPGHAAIGGTNR